MGCFETPVVILLTIYKLKHFLYIDNLLMSQKYTVCLKSSENPIRKQTK